MSIHDELTSYRINEMGVGYVAPQVARLLGYKHPGTLASQIRSDWVAHFEHGVNYCYVSPEASRRVAKELSLTSGMRRMIFLSEAGLRLVLMFCKLPRAKVYQKELAAEGAAGAIEKDAAATSPAPASMPAPSIVPSLPEPETSLVKQSQMLRLLAEQAEKMEALAEWKGSVDSKLALLETRALAPPPQLQLPPKSLRAAIERHMKDSVDVPSNDPSYGMKIQNNWQRLYLEFYDRKRMVLRPSGNKLTGLDVAEERGVLADLMALALELWPARVRLQSVPA